MKHVIFLYPAVKDVPIGGLKVVFDYANKLVEENYKVTIVYASYFKNISSTIKSFFKSVLKYLYLFLFRKKCSWYKLDDRINELFVWEYSNKNIPDGDIYLATAVTTVEYMMKYVPKNKSKFYFIQGYENFIYNDDLYIMNTYKTNCKKIIVSNWLKNIVEKESKEDCFLVPNGFDNNIFRLTIPIHEKNKFQISMLYHEGKSKDIKTGLKALELIKKEIPELIVYMFGIYKKPNNLPSWIVYFQNPSQEKHLEINNTSAIYLGCSKEEGWGLTIGEAMMCGQAVVCTDNLGYKEMAVNNVNALLSPVGNAKLLAQNAIKLIKYDELRIRIASTGLESIKEFEMEKSYELFKNIII